MHASHALPRPALVACLALTLVATSPACDDAGLSPSDATASDLHGWWRNVDSETGQVRHLGFLSPADALRSVAIYPDEATQDVSAVFHGQADASSPQLVQLAHYSVSGGAILQTVLADIAAPVGQQYSTELFAIAPGDFKE